MMTMLASAHLRFPIVTSLMRVEQDILPLNCARSPLCKSAFRNPYIASRTCQRLSIPSSTSALEADPPHSLDESASSTLHIIFDV
jgi:hypothetical protein